MRLRVGRGDYTADPVNMYSKRDVIKVSARLAARRRASSVHHLIPASGFPTHDYELTQKIGTNKPGLH